MVDLFAGDDIEVRHFDEGGDTCVITFTSLAHRNNEGFGENLFKAAKISAVHFIHRWAHWYQTPEVETAVDIAATLIRSRYSRRIGYGMSMGGYGVAAHAKSLRLHQMLMFAPQFCIVPTLPPYEKRWSAFIDKIPCQYDFGETLSADTQAVILYDPSTDDRLHARLFANHLDATLIRVPFSGHVPAEILRECGLIKSLVLSIIRDDVDWLAFRRSFRERRRLSATYWYKLGTFAQRRFPAIYRLSAHEAYKIDPKQLAVVLRLVDVLIQEGRFTEAKVAAEQSIRLLPKHPAGWRALARTLLFLNDPVPAVAAAYQAVALRQDDVDLLRVLLHALEKANLFDEAAQVAGRAIALAPDHSPAYAAKIAALRRIGKADEAEDVRRQAADRFKDRPDQGRHFSR